MTRSDAKDWMRPLMSYAMFVCLGGGGEGEGDDIKLCFVLITIGYLSI